MLLKRFWQNKCDPRGLTIANFNLHFIQMFNNKYHCIWSTCTRKQDFLSIMLYKDYVNLCDFRVGSYVTLGTRAAQSHIYMSLGSSNTLNRCQSLEFSINFCYNNEILIRFSPPCCRWFNIAFCHLTWNWFW